MTSEEWCIIDYLMNIVEDERTIIWLGDLMFTDKELTQKEKDRVKRLQIKYMDYGNEETGNAYKSNEPL